MIVLALAVNMGWTPAVQAQDERALPAGPGPDETVAWCSGCQSRALVMRQGMSRERWNDIITWMVENETMRKPCDEQRKVLLVYLSARFGAAKGAGCTDTPWGRRCL
ncbi:hypothetical protein [Microvirga makkahensis]|uniref:Uncharacterized protein n=1 Tax=Microvirga makkahensis TaxID=1128670 RepID=A0A7X3MR72_9HYPH|nr:hypothetical protein [Microvirga makkahensis]MXQ11738.1 hypothetical protein [Microvirga makkahensis]